MQMTDESKKVFRFSSCSVFTYSWDLKASRANNMNTYEEWAYYFLGDARFFTPAEFSTDLSTRFPLKDDHKELHHNKGWVSYPELMHTH